jgi:hypothetical protein
MNRAFVLTAYNRPDYLKPVIESLTKVRGWEDWHVVFRIEPSPVLPQILELVSTFIGSIRTSTSFEVIVNPERYGVLRHPWVAFDTLFNEENFDYVLRSEDDLIHGQDILEYHKWASVEYKSDSEIGIVGGFADDYRDHSAVRRVLGLGTPLLIGTWKNRWNEVFRENWDFDYSTGTQEMPSSGWDVHLNHRVMPPRGLHAILPLHTKCEHIGVYGAHSNPSVFFAQPPFDPTIRKQHYREESSDYTSSARPTGT